ncbi:MAG: phosphoribosylaminoimidazolesuccinocarboxamide synthase [Candidatus Omnitrophica bacterium]|nr:phosphoribosylaminoimidazolesuccinocarboxamide synthase [Candidatus Omnitrophota bacterium]
MKQAITSIQIPGAAPAAKGKVRDIFDLGDKFLLVATDRISAFDCILPQGVPDKGAILTQMSLFWFETLAPAKPHHVISTEVEDFPEPFCNYPEILAKRSMLVKKVEPLPVECVVRGYIAGSAWAEYQENRTICGILLPENLRLSDPLPKPIFTPASKNKEGHDENISFDEAVVKIGGWEAEELRERSLEIFKAASDYAKQRGVILADTKFEFGREGDEIILIDEILTPDSSRFWLEADYQPGKAQEAFDKQFVRDFLINIQWDRNPPPPDLPDDIVENTRRRYIDAYRMLTGKEWNSD